MKQEIESIKKIFFLALFFGIFALPAYGAPSISPQTPMTGYAEGATIGIVGSGFGEKLQVSPLVWDDFENGTIDSGVWHFSPGSISISDTGNRSNSKYYAKGHMGSGTYNRAGSLTYDLGQNSLGLGQELYASMWRYWDPFTAWQGMGVNQKIFRFYPPNIIGGANDWVCAYHDFSEACQSNGNCASFPTSLACGVENTGMPGNPIYSPFDPKAPNIWTRIEVYIKTSSAVDADDGITRIWYNGILVTDQTTRTHSSTNPGISDQEFRRWVFDNYGWETSDLETQINTFSHMDDLYLDTNRARIEICNSANWDSQRNCEIQLPIIWSDDYISATINQGAFSGSSSAWLYVVDSTGTANTNGYPIIFNSNGNGETTAPNIPSGLSVS